MKMSVADRVAHLTDTLKEINNQYALHHALPPDEVREQMMGEIRGCVSAFFPNASTELLCALSHMTDILICDFATYKEWMGSNNFSPHDSKDRKNRSCLPVIRLILGED